MKAPMADSNQDQYTQAAQERERHTKAVLDCVSDKIVVVAGPGTGKTWLFTELINKKAGKALTLTFINALVDDLSLGLFGLSEVRTLHSFSASILHGVNEAKIFPKLAEVIQTDAEILLGKSGLNFEAFFQKEEIDAEYLEFYKKRKDYYGRYYGYSDVVFAVVQYFRAHPNKIPKYRQVLVDEFQDFNKIEVTLVDLLSQTSPTLIAGDDDQSLYINLKNANPAFIRQKHSDPASGYVSHPLAYCSRCTRVVVEAANDIVQNAKANGLLQDRIDKPYVYFPCESKDRESDANPHLIYTQRYQTEMPGLLLKEITKIAKIERKPFSVLVVVPPQLKAKTIPYLASALRKKGFRKIFQGTPATEKAPTMLDGLKLLIDDKDDPLGWRVVAECCLAPAELEEVIRKTEDGTHKIVELMPAAQRTRIRRLLANLRKAIEDKPLEVDELQELFGSLGYKPLDFATAALRDDFCDTLASEYECPRGVRDIPITITTVPSSKGLAGDYVFVTHFDDQYYSHDHKGTLADQDIFNFAVALTRARKRVYLVSSKDREPALLHLIHSDKVMRQMDAPHQKSKA
jgi:superfamily I DNA/RNA helicase